MHAAFTLTNEIRVRREKEWLCRGIPFPRGALNDVGSLRLQDESGHDLPLGTEKIASWPDGSVKWALLQFPVSFAAQGHQVCRLSWDGGVQRHDAPASPLRLDASGPDWVIDNGRLRLSLPLSGEALLTGLACGDRPLARRILAKITDDQGCEFHSEMAGPPVVEHQTPAMLVVSRRGVHRGPEARKFFSFSFRLTLFAGSDDLEIEYQFIHDEPRLEDTVQHARPQGVGHVQVRKDSPGMRSLRSVRLVVEHAIDGAREFCTCPFFTVGNRGLLASPRPLRALLTNAPQTALYDAMIDADVYDGDRIVGGSHGLASVGDGQRGLAVSIIRFAQQWPKGWSAGPDRLVLDLWPETAGALHLFQGQAKTHQVRLRAFEGAAADAHLPDWHFAGQFPVVLAAPDWFLDSGALGPVLRYQPKKYPEIEKMFRVEFEQFLAYNRALGMMDYGDYESLGEASWGRPDWMSNLEHDFGQTVYLQAVRTGLYRYYDYFEAAIRHVMDVDCVHHDDRFDLSITWREMLRFLDYLDRAGMLSDF